MEASRKPPSPTPDQRALASLGTEVRNRLMNDPAILQVAVEGAELFAAGSFLSAGECGRLVTMIDEIAQPSRLFDSEYGGIYRTSYSSDLDGNDSLVRMIDRRICDLLGIKSEWGESIQGQRYSPGQEFHGHYDWFDPTAAYWPGENKRGGQRSWTAMVYLNDVEEGGATVFERLGVSVQPQAGAMLAWNNARPDGSLNPEVLHAAKPVIRGVKYVITKWFRTRTWL